MKHIMILAVATLVGAAPSVALAQQHHATTAPGVVPVTVHGELTLYEMTGFNGDDWAINTASGTVHTDWNIRSISVHPGDRWQICARPRFRDPCIILDRSVADASAIGIEGQIGSARPAPEGATNAPAPATGH